MNFSVDSNYVSIWKVTFLENESPCYFGLVDFGTVENILNISSLFISFLKSMEGFLSK